jgi:hypothetical protein
MMFVPTVEMVARKILVRAKNLCRIQRNSFDVYEENKRQWTLSFSDGDLKPD